MYGEYVEVDGRTVFVLCTPGTSTEELERRAREQFAAGEVSQEPTVDDGWQQHDNIAEWWQGDDAPTLVLEVPADLVLTKDIKKLIETAYERGEADGERFGREIQKAEMREALGLP